MQVAAMRSKQTMGRPTAAAEQNSEAWLLDWLTASYLPRFNQIGMLRVVRNAGLGAWLCGVDRTLLNSARENAMRHREKMERHGVKALICGYEGYPSGLAQIPDALSVLVVNLLVRATHKN